MRVSPASFGVGHFKIYTMNNLPTPPPAENHLLVVNHNGRLRELFCPFKVLCIMTTLSIPTGTWVYVDKVSGTLRVTYEINDHWYSSESFVIIIEF